MESEALQIAELLLRKRWSVIFASDEVFITSDTPVSVNHESRPKAGFGTLGAVVTFPLSSKRLLVLDDKLKEPGNQYYPLQAQSTGAINLNIWKNSNRFMITGQPVPKVLAEILSFEDDREDGRID